MCIRVVNTCSFVFSAVPARHKTQEMCDKAVDDNPNALNFVHDRYKSQKMCGKAVDDYSIALEFVAERCKSKGMCDKIISENPFMLKYCPYKYITQKMCDKAIDDFLPALNFFANWFVTSKMIKTLFTALCEYENILYFDEDFGNVAFNCNEMSILNIDLNNINLDNNFDEDNPGTIIHFRLLT